MPRPPLVSIVMPVFNDEEWVEKALESCLAQTLRDIEVICVDDASTDTTPDIVARFQAADPRVRLIRQPSNRSAFQARRAGILAATAPHVLFLDGDDELAPEAAKTAVSLAKSSGADVVAFGVDVIVPEGVSVGRFARSIQPRHSQLHGAEIIPALFPAGEIAQGHLWRYLWDVRLLRAAYDAVDSNLMLYRANDIPIAFLALCHASKYVSTSEQLYRYYWRRGVSGQQVADRDSFEFYLSALDSIDAIAGGVRDAAAEHVDADGLVRSYVSARRSVIQMVLRYCNDIASEPLRSECYARLAERVDSTEIIVAAATFFTGALPLLAQHKSPVRDLDESVKNVVILTGNLASGGLQGVVVSQAVRLAAAGFAVTVAARTFEGRVHELPENVRVIELAGASRAEKVASFATLLREEPVDVVVDHWLLYDETWPFFALVARTLGIPTVGWLHNFALRPIFDFSTRGAFLAQYLPLLARVVALSPLDVAFWKLRGVSHAVYLPNPPSPLLHELQFRTEPRTPPEGPIRLIWWGRLQQHTKRVRALVDVTAELRRLGVDFELTVIGPDSGDLTAVALAEYAAEKGVDDALVLPGALHGADLLAELERADLFVYTSAIEGYPLTLVEAQSLGLPIAMYELPWLATVKENEGIVAVPQGDAPALAQSIARIAAEPQLYSALSTAALHAAHAALSYDFTKLYSELLTGQLPADLSPDPTIGDARLILDLSMSLIDGVIRRERRYANRLLEQRNEEMRHRRQLEVRLSAAGEPVAVKLIRPFGRLALRLFPNLRAQARRFNRFVRGI